MPTKGFYLPADGKQEYLGEMPVIMISALLLQLWLLFHCRQFSTHGSYGQEKSGKMERVRESQGILKVSHCKKIKKPVQNNKKTYTFIVIKLIIHIRRYSVHAIHMPLRFETLWYQPLCTIFYSVTNFCCRLMHLLLVYLVLHLKKLPSQGKSFILSGSQEK